MHEGFYGSGACGGGRQAEEIESLTVSRKPPCSIRNASFSPGPLPLGERGPQEGVMVHIFDGTINPIKCHHQETH